jgi:glucose-6-phosphate isomerase
MTRRYGAADAARRFLTAPADAPVLSDATLLPLALAGVDVEALARGADDVLAELGGEAAGEHPVLAYAACLAAAQSRGALHVSEPRLGALASWWTRAGERECAHERERQRGGEHPNAYAHSHPHAVPGVSPHALTVFLETGAPAADPSGVERTLRVPPAAPDQLGDVAGRPGVERTLPAASDQLGDLTGRSVGELQRAVTEAARAALAQSGASCLTLAVPRLDEESLGALLAFGASAAAVRAALEGRA